MYNNSISVVLCCFYNTEMTDRQTDKQTKRMLTNIYNNGKTGILQS